MNILARYRSATLAVLMVSIPVVVSTSLSGAQKNTQLRPKFNWDEIKFVHAFGDSYTFVQGTRGTANFSFIGDALNFTFTPQQLLTNEIVPRNTSSDGSNWLEFLTGCFEGRPSECKRQLWDFAFAGADIDGNLLPLHHVFTVPLVDQVRQWIEFAADVIPHPDGQTLTTWWIGINDTGDTTTNATVRVARGFPGNGNDHVTVRASTAPLRSKITDFNAFWSVEMASYFNAVQAATDRGLRTHLFINVPPEERSPGSLGSPTKAALLKAHIDKFNVVLASQIATFQAANPDTTIMTFDVHAWFNMVLDNPQEFGFTNTTGFCTCAAPTGFFWFNTGHPTERVHQLLAQAVESQLRGH